MSFALEPGDETASLVGLLDNLLDQGVHVAGDLVIGLADVDLIRASLRLLVASEDTARRTGHDGQGAPPVPPRHEHVGRRAGTGAIPRERTRPPAAGGRDDRTAGHGSGSHPHPAAEPDEHDDDQRLVDGVARLVLTVVAVIHDLVERQAIRRVEAGSLSDEQVERLGIALQALEERMAEVRGVFGVADEDLDLDLGPLGRLR